MGHLKADLTGIKLSTLANVEFCDGLIAVLNALAQGTDGPAEVELTYSLPYDPSTTEVKAFLRVCREARVAAQAESVCKA